MLPTLLQRSFKDIVGSVVGVTANVEGMVFDVASRKAVLWVGCRANLGTPMAIRVCRA